MVGEIRDKETASMAVESALTGHLVLSTLHTNTAATTVTRLLELGVEGFLLRAALTGIMAQRLVRLTCEHCRVKETPAPIIRSAVGVSPEEEFTIGRGCPRCLGTGVFRRCAVYELMRVTPAIRDLIEPDVAADRIHAAALAGGMIPITEAAVSMARQGRISLTEAYRIRAD
jgi:type IV pilus assembly protein PilB